MKRNHSGIQNPGHWRIRKWNWSPMRQFMGATLVVLKGDPSCVLQVRTLQTVIVYIVLYFATTRSRSWWDSRSCSREEGWAWLKSVFSGNKPSATTDVNRHRFSSSSILSFSSQVLCFIHHDVMELIGKERINETRKKGSPGWIGWAIKILCFFL